ncbi:MAG: ABC transporter ATP-binding protein [Anaerolineae bacterium]|nr:ABC transporter ATP-binding protein [Anaerolineae bacterium]
MPHLEIRDLTVSYEKNQPTLEQFSLDVEQGELLSLLGPSGCGKTTTLRSVAGFIRPDAGRIVINGRDYTDLPPNKRDIGLVFQSYALFPHLTVFYNVAFGLRMRRIPKDEVRARVTKALKMVGLEAFANRRPAQLSGGQQQRVALARATVIEPQVLLLDEPLSNLDARLRVDMRQEIRRLQQQLGITTLYVTHDQVEAMSISDRVVVMNQGAIEQIGTPESIFAAPETVFVADFMGFDNRFSAVVESVGNGKLRVFWGGAPIELRWNSKFGSPQSGARAEIFFRADDASLVAGTEASGLAGQVILHTFHGNELRYLVETEVGEFSIMQDSAGERFESGAAVTVQAQTQKWIAIFEDARKTKGKSHD